MENFQYVLNIMLSLLLLQFSSANSSAYTVPDRYFINCGSNSDTNIGSKTFLGDLKSGLSSARNGEAIKDNNPQADTSPLYQTATLFRHTSSYDLLHISDTGLYVLRLHFFGFVSGKTNLSEAAFNVCASGLTLLSNFSVRTDDSPLVMEFLVPVSTGKFRIYFVPVGETSLAFVNAIEIFLVPQDYYMQDEVPDVSSSGSKGNYADLHRKVLQKVLRINIGGQPINETLATRATAAVDWERDDGYRSFSGNSSEPCSYYTGELKFEITNTYENIVPDSVYKTCIKLQVSDSQESKFPNISWRFNVKKNSLHLVRAHFCDIASPSPNITKFYIHIYNQFRQLVDPYNQYDLIDTAVPFFSDFVVLSDDSGFISVSVIPDDYGAKIAYLNGIEIMKFIQEPGVVHIESEPKRRPKFLIIGSVCGVVICLIIIVGLLFIGFRYRKRKSLETVASYDRVPYVGGSPYNGASTRTRNFPNFPNLNLKLKMPFAEILDATNNFDTKLLIGNGGFGKVYRGTLRNGMKVAVKRSDSKHGQGLPEFQTEVIVLSKIRHRHLVSLIGYCDEKSEMVLVYEFMEKGTLREHLYNFNNEGSLGSSAKPALTWKQRLEICIGSAKGLHYLHTGSDGGIIHRDVKSTNILLDEDYTAKVADFGLSRSGPPDPDELSTGVKGSFGYLDPEYLRSFQFTEKSDVYSFGVVLLEVLCARPAIINSANREEINLADWGLFWLQKGEVEKIIDPLLVGQLDQNSLRKFTEVVEKCLKEDGTDRPTMLDICWDLEYALQLQQTRMQRQPHEDSAMKSALEFNLDSRTIQGGQDDSTVTACYDSDTAVFSQTWIDAGR